MATRYSTRSSFISDSSKPTGVSRRNGYNREAHKSGRCQECGKLMRLAEMDKHMKSHTGERPHKCQYCSRSFAEKAAWARHNLAHVKAKDKLLPKEDSKLKCDEEKRAPEAKTSVSKVGIIEKLPRKKDKENTVAPLQEVNSACDEGESSKPTESKCESKDDEESESEVKTMKNKGFMNSIEKKYNLHLSKYTSNSKTKLHRCSLCPQTFSTRSAHSRHVSKFHKGQKPYQCKICQKTFLRSCSLRQHESFHSEERAFKCNICNASFRYKSNLYSHRATHTNSRSLRCHICGKCFRNENSLESHMELHDDGVNREFAANNEHKSQKFTQKAEDAKPVDMEEYNTPTFHFMQDVSYMHADNAESEEMDYKFKEEHTEKEAVDNQPPSPAQSPESTFVGSMAIKTYTPKPHNTSREITMCPICYKSLELSELQNHLQVHSADGKPHKCQYCEKSFSKKFEAVQHEYSHTGERPYSCEVCGNTFRYKSNWCRHRRVHNHKSTNGHGKAGCSSSNQKNRAQNWSPPTIGGKCVPGFPQKDMPAAAAGAVPYTETDPSAWEMFQLDGEDDGEEATDKMQSDEDVDPLSTEEDETQNPPKRIDPKTFAQEYNLPDIIIDEVDPEPEEEVGDEFMNEDFYEAQHFQIQELPPPPPYYAPPPYVPVQIPISLAYVPEQVKVIANLQQRQQQPQPYPQLLSCTICKRRFQSKRELFLHKEEHARDRRVTCEICNKTFAHRFSLTQHALVHTGVMPFSCDICDKKFRFKSNYTKHNKLHHPELVSEGQSPQRNGRSPQMQKFIQDIHEDLQDEEFDGEEHEQVQKVHKCGFCGQAFQDSSELRLHVLSHKLGLSYVRTSGTNIE